MGSSFKPLGGIAKITLGVASSVGAAPTLPEGGVELALLEDRSTYTETATWCGTHKSVSHCIEAYTAADKELPDELTDALTEGFVAQITLNSGAEFMVGWSAAAGSDRPLRLVSCTSCSCDAPATRGYKRWLWESIDGSSNM